ncbi:MAG: phosphoribosylglycinamide formyltransferase [Oligoflexia bacterium]|nr:phosphoribosylglycinamide formyltransferase [Oligoflexia bacterium]
MRPGRLAILISGNGSTAQALIDHPGSFRPVLVIGSKECYGLKRAMRSGIRVEVIPQELRKKDRTQDAELWILARLKASRVDAIFLAGFMKIVTKILIDPFKGKIWNIHPSLLPKFKGLHALDQALKAGETVAGATVHHVVEEMDSGPTIKSQRFEIPEHRDPGRSELLLHIHETRLLRGALRGLNG